MASRAMSELVRAKQSAAASRQDWSDAGMRIRSMASEDWRMVFPCVHTRPPSAAWIWNIASNFPGSRCQVAEGHGAHENVSACRNPGLLGLQRPELTTAGVDRRRHLDRAWGMAPLFGGPQAGSRIPRSQRLSRSLADGDEACQLSRRYSIRGVAPDFLSETANSGEEPTDNSSPLRHIDLAPQRLTPEGFPSPAADHS